MNAFDVASFHHQRKGLFGSELYYFDDVKSTNSIAEKLARDKFSEGTVVLANSQSLGRGRNSNQWFSPKDVNLYSTILLKPSKEFLPRIPFIAGLSVARALFRYNLSADLKWPNDVLIGDRKIAGILMQSAMEADVLQYVIVGIGINVNVTNFPNELQQAATSVAIEKGTPIQREQLLADVLFEFEQAYAKQNGTSWEDFVNEVEKQSSYLRNCHVEVNTTEGTIEGTTAALDSYGGLIVNTKNGQAIIHSGEVRACRKK
ncbi:MAG TPA: biotin--[acetyl-CoA-carboxylase] ligase [Acidobacteriota bacterium]|nr:biotin--[acetyl-CoA-carboxylase] ligase [Acidobacteriota bacterium]